MINIIVINKIIINNINMIMIPPYPSLEQDAGYDYDYDHQYVIILIIIVILTRNNIHHKSLTGMELIGFSILSIIMVPDH